MTKKKTKERTKIPMVTKRQLLIECGYKCSVPRCSGQWPTLAFHHINWDPSDHDSNNILVLCPTHHQMASSKHIPTKDCKMRKQIITNFSKYESSEEGQVRIRLLYALAAELYLNLNVLSDGKFQQLGDGDLKPVIYPRYVFSHLASPSTSESC
jgi:hypothetical protein